jgi:hypothetical protein
MKVVDLVREVNAQRWRPWQPRIIEHVLRYPRTVIQGARQGTGKTSTLAKFIVACVLYELSVGVGMPTLRQGGRLILREVLRRIEPFQRGMGSALRLQVRNSLEYVWANGGSLTALSTDEAARAGAQGYTFDVLIIDEGHETTPEATLDVFAPLTDVAMMERRGRIVVIGVGGTPGSLIEQVKDRGYAQLRIDDEEIVRLAPAWAEVFAQRKQEFSERQYRQMYRVLPVLLGGGHAILPDLRAEGKAKWLGGGTIATLGVDIGRSRDQTVATLLEHRQGLKVWQETLVLEDMPFTQQVPLVVEFARARQVRPENIAIEVNGLGQGFYDIAAFGPGAPLRGSQAVMLDYGLKHDVLELMNRDARDGTLVVPDHPGRGASLRQHLSGLRYVVKAGSRGAVRLDYDHSDDLSSGIMAYVARQRMGAAA